MGQWLPVLFCSRWRSGVFLCAERFHVQPVNRHGVQPFRGEGPICPAGVVPHQAAQRTAALVLFGDKPHGAGADDALEPGRVAAGRLRLVQLIVRVPGSIPIITLWL